MKELYLGSGKGCGIKIDRFRIPAWHPSVRVCHKSAFAVASLLDAFAVDVGLMVVVAVVVSSLRSFRSF